MTPEQKAAALAKYFEWEVPSEQYCEVLKALREYGNERIEAVAKLCDERLGVVAEGPYGITRASHVILQLKEKE